MEFHRWEIEVGGVNSWVVRRKMEIDIIDAKRRIEIYEGTDTPLKLGMGRHKADEPRSDVEVGFGPLREIFKNSMGEGEQLIHGERPRWNSAVAMRSDAEVGGSSGSREKANAIGIITSSPASRAEEHLVSKGKGHQKGNQTDPEEIRVGDDSWKNIMA